jgi:hypothetical protein
MGRREEVLDGEKLLRVDQGHDALVRGGLGQQRQLLARLLSGRGRRPGGTGPQALERSVTWSPLAGHEHVVKAPLAGLEGLLAPPDAPAVENFHEWDSVDGMPSPFPLSC